MNKIRTIATLCKIHLQKEFSGVKIYLVSFLSAMLIFALEQPIADFIAYNSVKVTPYSIAFIFSDFHGTFTSMLMLLGFVWICSDSISNDSYNIFCLLRVGRKDWMVSKLLFLVLLDILYVGGWFAFSLIPFLGDIIWTNDWGRVWNTLAFTSAGNEIGLKMDVSAELIIQYSAMEALLFSVGLKCIVCLLLGLIVMCGNVFISSGVGICAGIIVVLLDIFANNGGYGYWFTWFSPPSMSRLVMLDKTQTFLFPSIMEACVVMMSESIVLATLLIFRGSKKINP